MVENLPPTHTPQLVCPAICISAVRAKTEEETAGEPARAILCPSRDYGDTHAPVREANCLLITLAAVQCAGARAARAAFEPTGDALYDRYAQAVLSQPNWPPEKIVLNKYGGWFADNPFYRNVLTLPDEVLADWEAEFGGDPRYWQLRAYCTAFRRYHSLSDDEPDLAGGAAFLREAWSRGVADAETLLLIHLWEGWPTGKPVESKQEQAMRDALAQRGHRAEKLAKLSGWELEAMLNGIKYDCPSYLELAPQCELEEEELLSAAIALGPDECWPYWRRAIYWLSYGEPECGLADLKAGNQASVCRYPMCFPVSFVYDELAAGKVAGKKVLAGLLLEEAAHSEMLHNRRDTIVLKERYKEAVVMYSLSGDYALLAEQYVMASRLGGCERRSSYTSYNAALLASHPANNLLLTGVVESGSSEALALLKINMVDDYALEQIDRHKLYQAFADPARTAFYMKFANDVNCFGELYQLGCSGLEPYYYPPTEIEIPAALQADLQNLADPLVRGPLLWDAWRADYEFTQRGLDWLFPVLAKFDMRSLSAPEGREWSTTSWYGW